MASTTVGIKLDDETRDRLRKLGEIKQRSPHWLMKAAIRDYLDREEVRERERMEDEERWKRFVDSGAHVSHEDMADWMGELVKQAETQGRKKR